MSICPCNCKYHRSMDIKTPRMLPLSAFFKRSFAFHSVRERFPIVIKRIMEDLMKRRDVLAKQYGESVREELKKAVDELAALKFELQSNKELTPIVSENPDAAIFNDYLQRKKAEDGHTSPYSTSILFAEAYLYRRLRMIFENKKILKDYDCFKKFKEDAFEDAIPIMRELAIHMEEGCECISDKDAIFDFMKIALWANKYDLSINKGVERGVHLNMARKLEPNVVCDHSEAIWEAFHSNRDNDCIAYVPNNAGYELFCDLCLADMLTTKGLTSHVTFHLKTIPSYVSDVTKDDINWMIETLKNHVDPHLRCLGQRWHDYVTSKIWDIEDNPFWHYPLDYTHMLHHAPALHAKLASVNLIIFKGDLAYRKLFGDINWDPNTPVDQGLRGFLPAKLCVLRTIKYGVVCGIPVDVADKCMKADNNWKESGNYGLLQYCDTIYVEPPQEEMVFPPDPCADSVEEEEGPREATDEESNLDEEGPQPEVEGGGDLGQADQMGGERETTREDDVAGVVDGLVGQTSERVYNERGERETTREDDVASDVDGLVGQTSERVDNEREEESRPDSTGVDHETDSDSQEDQVSDGSAEDASEVEDEDQTVDKGESEPLQHLTTDTEEVYPSTVRDDDQVDKDREISDTDHPVLEDTRPAKKEHSDKHVKVVEQGEEDSGVEGAHDDDRGLHDTNRTDGHRAPPAATSNEQDIPDIPKHKKKILQRAISRWKRFVAMMKNRRNKQGANKNDENSKVGKDDEGKDRVKTIASPIATKPQAENDGPPTKEGPSEKLRTPDSPSEVSVYNVPDVDGEEAPE